MNTAIYLIRAVLLITAGVIIANIVLESDAMRKLSPLIRPFCSAANLPKEGAVSLFASFFNPTAGKSTLAGFYHEGRINDRETILTVLMSTFPIVVGESLFRVHVPIALVLLGPFIGSIYIALTLLSAFIQSFGAFVYAKLRLPQPTCVDEENYEYAEKTPKNQKLKTALKKSFSTLLKVLPIMVLAFLVVDLLFTLSLMNSISVIFDPVLRVLDLPGEVITALVADLAHFSAGYATVAALLAKGVITAKQAILTLLIGSMLMVTLVYLKYSLSMYISLFGKLGVKITVINYLSSMIAKVIMILLVVVVM
ncbi:MAG TPA: nucleoside recognition domain-containing protein [Candidatus Bathyarchaeia archaeon]|nr:nucleoside recognition domain-containing protein [Candidatus Bathyarchaeia archaeon]